MTVDRITQIEYEMMVLARHLSALSTRSRRSQGVLDSSGYTILGVLRVAGLLSIGDLSSITGLDASTLNRQTGALLRDGYVQRIADPDGGMARMFRPTESGLEALRDERDASLASLTEITAAWSGEEQASFAELLEKFNNAVELRSGRVWPRPE